MATEVADQAALLKAEQYRKQAVLVVALELASSQLSAVSDLEKICSHFTEQVQHYYDYCSSTPVSIADY